MSYINLVPWGISAISLIVAILTFNRNGKKDDKEEIQKEESKFDNIRESLIKANVKLDTVCNTTNETRLDIKAMNKELIELGNRVTKLETNMKRAFEEIDDLKGKES
jgi:peptidoglycan hydrolase CwlO-like protein